MSLQKALCLICARPTADGAILAVHVDKEKLQTWFLIVCGHELPKEIAEEDKICYFCLWQAEFMCKLDDVMADAAVVWWPRNLDLDNEAKELRKNFLEGNANQCWVQLEKVKLPELEDEENRNPNHQWECIYFVHKRLKAMFAMNETMLQNYAKRERNMRSVNERIRRIAFRLGIHLTFGFEMQEFQFNLPKETFVRLALQLMKTKCTCLIRDESMEFWDMMQIFLKLVDTDNLKELDLTGFISFCKIEAKYYAFNIAIKIIAFKNENIEVFRIFREVDEESFTNPEFIVDPLVISSLKILRHLRELQIELFTFNLQEVMDICSEAPNLQHINVNFKVEQLPEKEELEDKLGNLRAFQFENMVNPDLELFNEFVLMCMNNLMKLQLIGKPCSPFCSKYEIIDSYLLHSSNLRHLSIGNGIKFNPDFPELFPLVSHLRIDFDEISESAMDLLVSHPLFTEVTSLNLQFISLDGMFNILHIYGSNLVELHAVIDDSVKSTSPMSYISILEFCPNLEKIYVDYQSDEEFFETAEDFLPFTKINELKIDLHSMIRSQIVAAPGLKKMEIFYVGFDEFFKKCSPVFAGKTFKRQVLRNLEHLTIDMRWFKAEQVDAHSFKQMALMIKIAEKNLRCLSVIKLKLNCRCDYLKLAKALKDEATTNEDIQMQGWLWDKVTIQSLTCIVDDALIDILESKRRTRSRKAMAVAKVNLKEHIRRIASKLGIILLHDFDLEQLSNDLPKESFVPLALKLLKTKCTFLVRDEDISLFFALNAHILKKLLNGYKPKELDLTGLMTFNKKTPSKIALLKYLATYEPFQGIEVFRIFNDRFEKNFGNKLAPTDLETLSKNLKNSQLQYLRELQFEAHSFHLNEVMGLCGELPTLEHINVILGVQQLPERAELISKLGNLKAFQCVEIKYQDMEIYMKFIMMCMVNLTKLQLIGKPCSPFCTNYKIVDSDELLGSAALRHLCIDKWISWDTELSEKFPNVSHLKANFYDLENCNQNLKYLKKFLKIKSLNLHNITKQTLFNFLKTYGSNLRELHAVIDERDNSLSDMFYTKIWLLCPKLEKICVNYQINEEIYEIGQKTLLAASKINELKIDLKTMMKTIMVTAPGLKKMEMDCRGVHDSFMWYSVNLCSDITQKKILQELEHLTIDMYWFCPEQINAKLFKEVASIVKVSAEKLPKLTVIKFMVNCHCDYLKLAKALKDVKTTVAEIREIIFIRLLEDTVKLLRSIVDDKLIEILENFNDKRRTRSRKDLILAMAVANENLKEHIRRIASKLRIDLDPEFDLKKLSNDLPEESFVPLALKLMKTKCTFLLRNNELFRDLNIHILRELLIRYDPDEIDLTGLMTFSKSIYTKYFQLKILTTEAFQNIKCSHSGAHQRHPRSQEIARKSKFDIKAGQLESFPLQLIGKPSSPFCTNYDVVKSDELGSTTASSLRHLSIEKWMNRDLKFLQSFPEVSHLKVDLDGLKNYDQVLEYLKKFKKVKSLNLQHVTKQTMFHFLETYGYYLRELHAVIDERDDSTSAMFFTNIWLCCPNLEKIFVNYQTDKMKCFDTYQIALMAASNINELKIDLKTMMSTNIVTAPVLKKMEMNCEGFHNSFICWSI
ncbi:Hypothetical predicted protein [Cloeon dipterum]|uniref:Uncharacterized protein n=1 Tax=Cloeon dipterum TaxID=197152 RepID=A0A8S1E1T0_9INSE|nr:Hypothetical predicted protein [Cloeon dipterum]